MAVTRRAYDSFETRIARAGGEIAECLDHAKRVGCSEEEYGELLKAARHWNDEVRRVRQKAYDKLLAELSR